MSKFLRSSFAPLVSCIIILAFIFWLSSNLSGKAFSARMIKPDSLEYYCKSQSTTDSVYVYKADLDSIMQSWKTQYEEIATAQNDEQVRSIGSTLSIWLCIIAAICTLLPMAASIYQSWQSKMLEKDLDEKLKQSENKYKDDVDKHTYKLHKAIINNSEELNSLQNSVNKTRALNHLSIVITTMNTLAEIQDFNNSKRIPITETRCIRPLVRMLDNVADMISSDSSCSIASMEVGELRQVLCMCLIASNCMDNLMRSLESVFEGDSLISIITLRFNASMLSKRIGQLYETQNLRADETLSEIKRLTTLIKTVTGKVTEVFFNGE